ncbi:MAG: T9SS type A sorting domain-containing protein [candidate division KSB1 bacterium]
MKKVQSQIYVLMFRVFICITMSFSLPFNTIAQPNSGKFKVGAAVQCIQLDDSMPLTGGVAQRCVNGWLLKYTVDSETNEVALKCAPEPKLGEYGWPTENGKINATAIVIQGYTGDQETKLCIVAVDVLFIGREYLDIAAQRIEDEVGIPFDNILINASHTHGAPCARDVHNSILNEEFAENAVDAIVNAAILANAHQKEVDALFVDNLDDEEIGGGDYIRDLPLFRFMSNTEVYSMFFIHSIHNNNTSYYNIVNQDTSLDVKYSNANNLRSPGFYGLVTQDLMLDPQLGKPIVVYLSGAAGGVYLKGDRKTVNVILMLEKKIKDALKDTLSSQRLSNEIAVIKRPFNYKIREFDEEQEETWLHEAMLQAYPNDTCNNYPREEYELLGIPNDPSKVLCNDLLTFEQVGGLKFVKPRCFEPCVFRISRERLRPLRGTIQESWLQAIKIGDICIVATPGETFPQFAKQIKDGSPFGAENTFVLALTNDHIGYLPDESVELGTYWTWMGTHSFADFQTGEEMVQATLSILDELALSTAVKEPVGKPPLAPHLIQNYPNPFNPSTTIEYAVEKTGRVRLEIYDTLGKLVRTLVDEEKGIGIHSVVWDGKADDNKTVSSGTYFYSIRIGNFVSEKKMLLLR